MYTQKISHIHVLYMIIINLKPTIVKHVKDRHMLRIHSVLPISQILDSKAVIQNSPV